MESNKAIIYHPEAGHPTIPEAILPEQLPVVRGENLKECIGIATELALNSQGILTGVLVIDQEILETMMDDNKIVSSLCGRVNTETGQFESLISVGLVANYRKANPLKIVK